MTEFGELSEIISKAIKPGMSIAIGGGAMFTKPMEVVREIIRQKIKDLHIVTLIGDMDVDLLIGAGAVKSLHASYVGLPMIGMARNFRRAIEKDHSLDFYEWTELSMVRAFQAGAMGVPKVAIRSLLGSDLIKVRKDFNEIEVEGKKYVEIPALNPDLAIVHAYAADNNGNIFYPKYHVLDDFSLLPAFCSKQLLVSVEKKITNQEGRELIEKGQPAMFSYLEVDYVIEAPKGALPTGFPPMYAGELGEIMTYSGMAYSEDGFNTYLEEYVYDKAKEV
ncbi:MAG: CoA transferase subunit A [Candidatus Hodarchaeales archaeon]